jgi:hypothetical protein
MALTREQATELLWERGDIDWKLRPEQRKLKTALESGACQLAVFNISRRLGKTFTLVTYAIEQAIRTRQKVRYGCAFLSDLEEFVLPAFALILEDCPERVRPKYIRSRKTWEFPNGSEIKLIGIDKNPEGLRGNAINVIIIDEAAFVSNLRHVYTSVIIPATAKQTNIKLIFISTPPESPEHFFVELINKAQLQANGYYATLTIDDISDLTPVERKRLLDEVGGEDSPVAQREFFCKIIIDATRALCPSFKAEDHVRPVTTEHVKWWLFGDTGGVRDKTVFLEVGYDQVTQLVLFRSELAFDRNTATPVIIAAVKAKWPGNTNIVLDAPGQLRVDYSSAGLPTTPPQKDDFAAGLLLLLAAFHNGRAVIDPSCALLIRTLGGGMLNKQRTDYERSEALGHGDAAAAAIYSLRGVDRVTDLRPKPKREDIFFIPTEPEYIKQLKGLTYRGR